MKLSAREKENTKPGECSTCGAFSEYRNTAGQCPACHNNGYRQYQQRLQQHNQEARASGRAFWESQGVKPGDRVERYAASMLGIGGLRVVGIAKVGAVGAYVSAPHCQRGYLTRHGWRRVGA